MSQHLERPGASSLRQKTYKLRYDVAEFIDRKLPGVTPDHLTNLGVAMIGVGSAVIAAGESQHNLSLQIAGGISIGLGLLVDGIDGAVATVKARQGKHNTLYGKAADDRADALGDGFLGGLGIVLAFMRHNEFAEMAAILAFASDGLPRYFGALAQQSGRVVPEAGGGRLQWIGTRPRRLTLKGMSIPAALAGLPDIQAALNLVSAAGNASSAWARYQLGKEVLRVGIENIPAEERLDEDRINAAKLSVEKLQGVTRAGLAIAAGAGGLAIYLR